jgi:hypothetical protein
MSNFTSIIFTFEYEKVSIVSLIEKLKESNWHLDDNGQISYLPLNDDDNFDWKSLSLEEEELVLKIVREKENQGELIGLVFTWDDTQIGGQFLINNSTLSLIPSLNRQKINNSNFTDRSWYLERLVPILKDSFGGIKSINIEESE